MVPLEKAAIKIIGIIPRNAALALIGANVFHMATDLQAHITAGKWNEISTKWKLIGGNPDKLLATIQHGAGKPETDDTAQTLDVDTVSGFNVIAGPEVVAAILTAAAPILALLSQYLTHRNVQSSVSGTVDALNQANPAGHYTLVNGQLYSNGQPVTFTGDSAGMSNTVLKNVGIAFLVAGGTYLLINKKGRKKKNYVLPAAAGLGAYLIMQRLSPPPPPPVSASQLLPSSQPSMETGQVIGPGTSIIDILNNIFPSGTNQVPVISPDVIPVSAGLPGGVLTQPIPGTSLQI
jgi:hypothetical protein